MGIPFEICHSMFSGDRAVFRTYRHAMRKFSRSQRLDTVKQFKRTPFKKNNRSYFICLIFARQNVK